MASKEKWRQEEPEAEQEKALGYVKKKTGRLSPLRFLSLILWLSSGQGALACLQPEGSGRHETVSFKIRKEFSKYLDTSGLE